MPHFKFPELVLTPPGPKFYVGLGLIHVAAPDPTPYRIAITPFSPFSYMSDVLATNIGFHNIDPPDPGFTGIRRVKGIARFDLTLFTNIAGTPHETDPIPVVCQITDDPNFVRLGELQLVLGQDFLTNFKQHSRGKRLDVEFIKGACHAIP